VGSAIFVSNSVLRNISAPALQAPRAGAASAYSRARERGGA
jgi:hypothetical protein